MRSLTLVALLVAASCSDAELTRRYDSVDFDPDQQSTPLVMTSAFVLAVPADPATTPEMLKLSERAQKAFVESIRSFAKDKDDFRKQIGGKLGAQATPSIVDRTVFKRRIVLSAEKAELTTSQPPLTARRVQIPVARVGPADRISSLRTELDLTGTGFKFKSWNRFETKFETVDLGKLTLVKGNTYEAGVSAGPKVGSSFPVSGTGKATATRTLTEEVSLRQQYVALSGILRPQSAVVSQEGVVGIDLAGNAILDLVVRAIHTSSTEFHRFSGLRKKDGTIQNDSQSVKITISLLKFATSSKPVQCAMKTDYVYREVVDGDRTVIEGDDDVIYRTGMAGGDPSFELLSSQDLKVHVWVLATIGSGGAQHELHLEHHGVVTFLALDDAEEFLRWITATNAMGIPAGRFFLNDRQISAENSCEALSIQIRAMN